jgi:hypothetical protein
VLVGLFIYSVISVLNGGLIDYYGWLIPIILIGSLVYLPAFIRSGLRVFRGDPMIYIDDDKLIAFDKKLFRTSLDDITGIVALPDRKISVNMRSGTKDISLKLSSDSPEDVVRRFGALNISAPEHECSAA